MYYYSLFSEMSINKLQSQFMLTRNTTETQKKTITL